jgi:ribosomal protein S18 acetylase RimI-like enzyme
MNIINRLCISIFNSAPTKNAIQIKSFDQKRYWLIFDEHLPTDILVIFYGHPVGLIKLLWHDDVLELCNIHIFIKYRGRGIGTTLINWLISFAKQNHVEKIWGIIRPEKQSNFDRLLNWYIKQGFLRESPDNWVISYLVTTNEK